MRVHEAAKKHGMKSEDLLKVLRDAGIEVKSHMSGMTNDMVAVVEKNLKPQKTKTKAKPTTKAKPKTAKVMASAPKETKGEAKVAPKVAKKPEAVANKTKVKAKVSKAKTSVKTSGRQAGPERRASAPATPVTRPKGAPARPKRPPARKRDTTPSDAQQKAVRESVRRTLAKIDVTRRTKRRKGKLREEASTVEQPVRVSDGVTVRELAQAYEVEPQEIITRCMELGLPVAINQSLEKETVDLLADDLGRPVQFVLDELDTLVQAEAKIEPSRLKPRAPIVTVMGHVDHGKTSILDYIRKTRVASGEAGGITQHIGAYEVDHEQGKVTFVDTPGHEAFTAMRARGAQVTDIVVLVVAADDGVMPQTLEAINHAKAAGVPILVAINKTDLPAADPGQIRQQLSEREVVVEDFGGEVVSVPVSAKTGDGIDKLLEMILLQAELIELTADREASAQAVAVEVRKEEGRGILCTVLITQGTLRIGDVFVVGSNYGKVRALLDHRGKPIREAGPSTPALVLGCNGMPEAGDKLTVVSNEREARDLSVQRLQVEKERERKTAKKLTLEELYSQIQHGDLKELRLVVKGDTNGSVEALTGSLVKLSIDEVVVKVLHAAVGVVGESDVLLAASSDALIIAFSAKVSPSAQDAAEREKVDIKSYDVIYECISDVDDAMKGLLEPERVERILGRAEVRKVYKISKLGQIAGSFILEGSIARNAMVRVLRNEESIFEGRVSSLKRFQEDVREVQKDFECGIGISSFGDLREGDVLEAFVVEERARVF